MTTNNEATIEKKLTLSNKLGLHARASAKLVGCAKHFDASITIQTHKKSIDAKRIMEVMMLGAKQGTELNVSATGNDANKAINSLSQLINNKFGEEQ